MKAKIIMCCVAKPDATKVKFYKDSKSTIAPLALLQ